jgi:hypothetical protein
MDADMGLMFIVANLGALVTAVLKNAQLTSVTTLARPGEPKYILSCHSEPWNRLCFAVRLLCEDPDRSPRYDSGDAAKSESSSSIGILLARNRSFKRRFSARSFRNS